MYRVVALCAVCVGLFACDDDGGSDPLRDAMAADAEGPAPDVTPDAAPSQRCVRDDQCPSGSHCPDTSGNAVCSPGCRLDPDSCRAADRFTVCDPDSRACVAGPCAEDADCRAGSYCADGACVEGCRLDPDDCGPDPDGVPRACDPADHTCRALSPCCADDDTCSMVFEEACDGQPITATLTCQPSPCGPDCEADEDCDDGAWCSGDGRCVAGCREVRGDCPSDTVCDPASRQCVRGACARNGQCPDWMYCGDAGLCRSGCRQSPDNCPEGTRCGPDRQCGSSCVDDDVCAEGEYCDSSVCRARCVPETHAGCVGGERCDGGRCVPGCADDVADIEGDDTRDAAPSPMWIGGVVESARYGDRVACPGDADLLVMDGPRVEATLRYDEVDGVLALRILDGDGAVLAEDVGGGAPKTLRADAPRAFVEVVGVDLVRPVSYRLDLRRVPGDGCFPDDRDPGDDEARGALRVGQRPQSMFVDVLEGAACPGDVDWSCFPMAAADGLEATVAGCAGLSAAVYTAEAALAGGAPSHTLEADGDRLRFSGDPGRGLFADGDWCVAVRNEGDGRCEDYALALSFQRLGEICADDLEPDDRPEDALVLDGDGPLADAAGRLPYGVSQRLPAEPTLCPGDVDQYRLTASAGDGLEAWLEAEGPGATGLTVDFVDALGRPHGSRGGATAPMADPNPARAVPSSDGPLYVVVGGTGGEPVDYALFVQRTRGDGSCPEDGWENVDYRDDTGSDAQRPADIQPGRIAVEGAALCLPGGADEDWYRVPIESARTRLCVDATFRHADADMNVQVFRVPEGECRAANGQSCCDVAADCDEGLGCAAGFCRAPIGEGISRTDNEFVDLDKTRMDVDDDILVRVFRDPDDRPDADDGPATYGLTITRAPEDPNRCEPDWRERAQANDNRATATALGAGREGLCDTWICDEERAAGDWFTIRVPAGSDRSVFIDFDAGEGALLLTAIDPQRDPERVVESVQRQADVQCINIRGAATERTVLLQVNADAIEPGGDRRVDYGLRVEPTDLSAFARGACDELSGGIFPDVVWPRLDL